MELKNVIKTAVVAFALGLASPLWGAKDYYVATNGNDANEGIALSAPFRTIQKAANLVQAGDTVYIRGGRYAPFTVLNKQGTEANRLVFKPYNQEAVTIDRDLGGDDALTGITIYDSSYITMEGLEVTDSRVVRMNILSLDACKEEDLQIIKQTPASGVHMNSSSNGPLDYIIIKNMNIHHNARIGLGSYGGKGPGRGVGNQYLNNTIHHNGGYAVYISGEDLVFRENRIYNNNAYGAHMYSASTYLQNPLMEKNMFINNGLARCYWFQSGDTVKTNAANTGLLTKSKDGIIRNNVIVGNYGDGINIHCYDQSGCNNHILNNTIVANRKSGISEFNSRVENIIQNNILYGNNSVFTDIKSSALVSHNFTADPRFVDPRNQNYRLQPNSPVIDAGLTLALVKDDFLGVLRPQGAGTDIGAYEFVSTVALQSPATPSGFSGTAVSAQQINLSWTDNSTNETGFRIERKTGSGGTYAQIATVGANVRTYQNTGLSADTTYVYRVQAYNSAGNSAFTNEATATTPATSSAGDVAGGFTQFKTVFVPQEEKELAISYSPSSGGGCEGQISIFNQQGQPVKSQMRGVMSSSVCEVKWTGVNDGGRPVASGVYTVILRQDGQTFTKKVAVVR